MRRRISLIAASVLLAVPASVLLLAAAGPAGADDIVPPVEPTLDPSPIDDVIDDVVDEVDDVVDQGDDPTDAGSGGGGSGGGGSGGGGSGGGGSGGGEDAAGGRGEGGSGGGGSASARSRTAPGYRMRDLDTRPVYRPFSDAAPSTDTGNSLTGTEGPAAGAAGSDEAVEAELASDRSDAAPGARHAWLLPALALLAATCVAFAVLESEPPSDRA